MTDSINGGELGGEFAGLASKQCIDNVMYCGAPVAIGSAAKMSLADAAGRSVRGTKHRLAKPRCDSAMTHRVQGYQTTAKDIITGWG